MSIVEPEPRRTHQHCPVVRVLATLEELGDSDLYRVEGVLNTNALISPDQQRH